MKQLKSDYYINHLRGDIFKVILDLRGRLEQEEKDKKKKKENYIDKFKDMNKKDKEDKGKDSIDNGGFADFDDVCNDLF